MAGNFTCGIYPVNIVGPACSGNGACVFSPEFNRGVCQCFPGWHGESDIQVTTSLTDCHIHATALLSLWVIYLVVQILFGIKFLPKIQWLLRRHHEQVVRNKEKGKTYSFYQNKPLMAWMPYFALGYPAQLVYTITEIASTTDTNLGRTPLLTSTYIIWRVTFYVALFGFQSNFLASLLKAEHSLDGVIRNNFIMSYSVLLCICAVSVCIVIPHVVPFDQFDPYLANVAIFFGACSLCFLFVVGQTVYIRRKVIKILDRVQHIGGGDSKSQRLRDKIIKFQLLSRNTAALQFLIYGVFCVFPYMWNKHDWLMPFSWLAVLRTMMEGLHSLVDTEQDRELTTSAGANNNNNNNGSQVKDQASRKRSSMLDTFVTRVRTNSNLFVGSKPEDRGG
ncbi:hypothetical protein BASA81_012739 [Batrachochytrium salamandrivorans]|nr:hypothetical protein BASA81_012739 [Batrachochytrium salamandrivorans]